MKKCVPQLYNYATNSMNSDYIRPCKIGKKSLVFPRIYHFLLVQVGQVAWAALSPGVVFMAIRLVVLLLRDGSSFWVRSQGAKHAKPKSPRRKTAILFHLVLICVSATAIQVMGTAHLYRQDCLFNL